MYDPMIAHETWLLSVGLPGLPRKPFGVQLLRVSRPSWDQKESGKNIPCVTDIMMIHDTHDM